MNSRHLTKRKISTFLGVAISTSLFSFPAVANNLVGTQKQCVEALSPTETKVTHETVAASLPKALQIRLQKEVKDALASLNSSIHLSAKVGQAIVQRAADAADETNLFLQTDPDLRRDFTAAWDGDELHSNNTRLASNFEEINRRIQIATKGFGGLLSKIKSKNQGKELLALVTSHESGVNDSRKQIEAVQAEMTRIRSIDNKLKEQETKISQETEYIVAMQEALYLASIDPKLPELISKSIQAEVIPSTVSTLNNLRGLQGLISATRNALEKRATMNANAIDKARANDTKWSAFITSPDADFVKKQRQKPKFRRFLGFKSRREKNLEELEERQRAEISHAKKKENEKQHKEDKIIEAEFCINADLCMDTSVYIIVDGNSVAGEIKGINSDGTFTVVSMLPPENSHRPSPGPKATYRKVKREGIAIDMPTIGQPGYKLHTEIFLENGEGWWLVGLTPDGQAILKKNDYSHYEWQNRDQIEGKVVNFSDLGITEPALINKVTGRNNINFTTQLGREARILAVFPTSKKALIRYSSGSELVPYRMVVLDTEVQMGAGQ